MKTNPLVALGVLFLVMTQVSLAHENCLDHYPELEDIENLQKKIEQFAANELQVRNAKCLRKTPITQAEMDTWMSQNQSTPNLVRTINGINFEGESEENLEAFFYLTTAHDILGRKIPNKNLTFKSNCKKVNCALDQIFGKETSKQLLYMQRRYGLNASHIVKDKGEAAAWTKSELDEVILAIADFPDGIFPIEKSRSLIHADRKTESNGVLANAIIKVFPLWNKQTPEERRTTIFHELSHALAGASEVDSSKKWSDFSGWSKFTKVVNGEKKTFAKAQKPQTLVSIYSGNNPAEDMAESAVAYRYNPTLLKNAHPGKYRFLKETLFDNVEYISERSCTNPARLSTALKESYIKDFKEWRPTHKELQMIGTQCSEMLLTEIAENGRSSSTSGGLQSCYVSAAQNFIITKSISDIKKKAKNEFLEPLIKNLTLPITSAEIKKVADSARVAHLNQIRPVFQKAIENKYACSESLISFSYQNYDEKLLGANTYRMKSTLEKVTKRACGYKNSNKKNLISEMVK